MTHSPPLATTAVALDDFEAISLEGPDAMGFAQAQCAGDLGQLAVAHWRWSCWLNPQGRVIALLLVLRISEHQLLLLAPGGRAAELAQRLRRFVFRAKVVVETPAVSVAGGIGTTASVPPSVGGAISVQPDVWSLQLGGGLQREIRIGGAAPAPDAAAREHWRAADVLDGIPWIFEGAVERWIPQALALDRLQAFSVRKGCYPGQEIVARTHFLGRNKRSLWLGRFEAADQRPGAGARLFAESAAAVGATGTEAIPEAAAEVVAEAVFDGHGHLLVVAREHCSALLRSSDGATAIELVREFGVHPGTI